MHRFEEHAGNQHLFRETFNYNWASKGNKFVLTHALFTLHFAAPLPPRSSVSARAVCVCIFFGGGRGGGVGIVLCVGEVEVWVLWCCQGSWQTLYASKSDASKLDP